MSNELRDTHPSDIGVKAGDDGENEESDKQHAVVGDCEGFEEEGRHLVVTVALMDEEGECVSHEAQQAQCSYDEGVADEMKYVTRRRRCLHDVFIARYVECHGVVWYQILPVSACKLVILSHDNVAAMVI